MEIRPRRILPTTEWISRQTEKSRVVFEKTRCVRECVGLKETRRNQTHWPWFRSWLHLLSVRRHTHAQMHHAIASLGIVCTWHWFLTDRPTCERTTCKCAHVFRPRKQDSALFFFLLSFSFCRYRAHCASHKTEATYIFLNILSLIQFHCTAYGWHFTPSLEPLQVPKFNFHFFSLVFRRLHSHSNNILVLVFRVRILVLVACVMHVCMNEMLGHTWITYCRRNKMDAISKRRDEQQQQQQKNSRPWNFCATNGRAGQMRCTTNLLHFKVVPSISRTAC